MQWLRDLGLKKVEVAKAIARFPTLLGCSIEEKLEPTIQWMRDLGLRKAEISKVIACWPFILGYSLEKNLKPKVRWLFDWFASEQVRVMLVRNPTILGRGRERWVRRSQILRECDKLSVFGSAITLTDAAFAKRYEGRL